MPLHRVHCNELSCFGTSSGIDNRQMDRKNVLSSCYLSVAHPSAVHQRISQGLTRNELPSRTNSEPIVHSEHRGAAGQQCSGSCQTQV